MLRLDNLLLRRPAQLSGGQRQRVALAKEALSRSPLCADAYVLLAEETAKTMHMADVKERVLGMGAVPAGDTPAQFQAYIDAERQRLADVIAKTGIVLAD